MTQFLLIRHAATDAVGRTIVGRLAGVHLNTAGRAQLPALVEMLAGERVDRLYASPLERVQQTAAPLAERWGLKIQNAEPLLEVDYGQWSGLPYEQIAASTDDWRRYYLFRSGTLPPGGETTVQTQARAVSFVLELRERHPDETVALVTHGDVIRTTLCYFLGMPLDLLRRLEVEPASISLLQLDKEDARVLYVNRRAP